MILAQGLQQLEEGKGGSKSVAAHGGGNFSGAINIEDAMENFEKGGGKAQ